MERNTVLVPTYATIVNAYIAECVVRDGRGEMGMTIGIAYRATAEQDAGRQHGERRAVRFTQKP